MEVIHMLSVESQDNFKIERGRNSGDDKFWG